MATPPVAVRARLDAAGRLLEADPPLAELHAAAGGRPGGVLAVPQIVQLARQARRLGVIVSRDVIAARGGDDLALTVRAAPVGEEVQLAIGGWRERAGLRPLDALTRGEDMARATGSWHFTIDPTLRLGEVPAFAAARAGLTPALMEQQPLSRLLVLLPDPAGAMPLVDGLAAAAPFAGQPAELKDGGRMLLAGTPAFDAANLLAGFRVEVTPTAAVAAGSIPAPPLGAMIGEALRAPLDRIIARAEAIRVQDQGPLRADYATYARDIAAAGRHLLALVGDLVDLSAIESAEFQPHRDRVDLAEVARRSAGLLAVRAAAKGVRIDGPAADEAIEVVADYGRTMQVLVNLVGNAVRYSPDDAAVWLRIDAGATHAGIVVADQGRGIAPADQARIFDKFERVDPAEPEGSGLGLYIARRLARAMGGDIMVESAAGQGARFLFTLPRA